MVYMTSGCDQIIVFYGLPKSSDSLSTPSSNLEYMLQFYAAVITNWCSTLDADLANTVSKDEPWKPTKNKLASEL